MNQSRKILTVSYGTYSCTADGFEDPLRAVKDTTQYFRGVVKQDRFFGAEPPRYDPEMAAALMQQEIAAGMAGDTLSLRPAADSAPVPWTDEDSAPRTQTAPWTPPEQARPSIDLADKLARIRAVVGQENRAEPATAPVPPPETTIADAPPEVLAPDTASDTAPDDAPDMVPDDAEALASEAVPDDVGSVTADAGVALPEADISDDPRIVPRSDAAWHDDDHHDDDAETIVDDAPPADPPHADWQAASDDDGQDAAFEELLAGLKETNAYPVRDDARQEDPAPTNADHAADPAPRPEARPVHDVPAPAPPRNDAPRPAAAPPRVKARVVTVKRERFENSAQAGGAARLGAQSDRLVARSSLSEDEEEALASELAAVRAELSHAPDTPMDTPPAPLRLDNPLPLVDPLPPEADTRAPMPLVDRAPDTAPDLSDLRKTVKLANPARAILTEHRVEDTDAERLHDQTASELDEPEGNRRRNAIAHLRAAVAATRADGALGRGGDRDAEAENAYREDLASVVRPRRPAATQAARTDRPSAGAQPRPDAYADTAQDAPVRPRRVTRDLDPQGDGAGGFAEYAAAVGAHALPDLLEAAAAYMAFVEGREQFSRPQLMNVLQRVDGGQSSREERLRSFGRLLRDGKIEKMRGGRFAATDEIRFRPDARAAG